MKQYIILLFSIFLISCNHTDPLIGTWERYGDEFTGMKIKVVKEGESFKASILYATDSCKLSGFVEGDIKWKNIKNTSENKYEFEDLDKSPVLFSDKFIPSYGLSNLEMVSYYEIHIRAFSKGTEVVGTEQMWKRVKAE